MKATCKLCGALIDTSARMDNLFDEKREERERKLFFEMAWLHMQDRNRCAGAGGEKAAVALGQQRIVGITQDNGWFQRWRLLQEVETSDPQLIAKKREWREYLHTLTGILLEELENRPSAPAEKNIQ